MRRRERKVLEMTQSSHYWRRFRVVNENGIEIRQGDILYKIPHQAEFEAHRMSEWEVTLKESGHVVVVVHNDTIFAMEIDAIEDSCWSLLIQCKGGVHVFKDKCLTEYMYTVPKGIELYVGGRYTISGYYVYSIYTIFNIQGYIGYNRFLDDSPFILKPFQGILVGRILNRDGVLVRQSKENYSHVVGVLNFDAKVYIDSKDFSDIPSDANIQKYRLIGDKGWINVFSQGNLYCPNVEIRGYTPFSDSKKDFYEMAMAIIPCQPSVQKNQTHIDHIQGTCISCMNRVCNALFLHEGEYGHNICCLECAKEVYVRRMGCPVCRKPIQKVIQIF